MKFHRKNLIYDYQLLKNMFQGLPINIKSEEIILLLKNIYLSTK